MMTGFAKAIELKADTSTNKTEAYVDELLNYQSFRVPGWTPVVEPKWGVGFDVPKPEDNQGQKFAFLQDAKNPHLMTFGVKASNSAAVDGWRMFVYDIKQESDLKNMITDIYGADCKVGDRGVVAYDETTKKNIYTVRAGSESGADDLGDGGCVLNFVYHWLYDEVAQKAVLVELGQAPSFFYCREGKIEVCSQKNSLQYLDSLISHSVHFI